MKNQQLHYHFQNCNFLHHRVTRTCTVQKVQGHRRYWATFGKGVLCYCNDATQLYIYFSEYVAQFFRR